MKPRDKLDILIGIVVDLAASDPVVHHEVDYGTEDAYTCPLCDINLEGDPAYVYQKTSDAPFPHAVTCPWRRAKEVTP